MKKAKNHSKPEKASSGVLMNKTGVAAAPVDAAAQAEASLAAVVGAPDGQNLAIVRAEYEKTARPLGTMPPPMLAKGIVQSVGGFAKGTNPAVLIDKIAERLAFERGGVRLYQGLVAKLDARGTFEGGPSRDDLLHLQQDELTHFQLLCTAMAMVGGDPTAMTPSADLAGVASQGLIQIIADPRTTLPQALQAILIAELTDNDGWQMLIDITDRAGPQELADRFEAAKAEEEQHLTKVRDWLAAHGAAAITTKRPDEIFA
ncbi:MAG: ferritin-like domain-containing protein [Polyangiaceae bacterium]|nr:ferritin-like domain-containing protein [Polyangiaceae bacterium]